MGFLLALAVLLAAVSGAGAGQVDGRVGVVTATAIAQSRAMAGERSTLVYDGVHPDVRNLLPRQAFAKWLAVQPYAIPTDDPAISNVSFGDWTSPATGATYADAAVVSLSLPAIAGSVTVDVMTTWVFVYDGHRWRWLPDIAHESIPEMIASAEAFPGEYQSPFRQTGYRQIDRFWQAEFYAANLHYAPPSIVPVTTDEIETGCGTVRQVRRLAVFYCIYDATIYFDPAFRDEVLDETGPVGWTAVVAHEWGHHIQALEAGVTGVRNVDPIDAELQADCLSALVIQDVYARGEIDDAGIADAIAVIELAGDVPGTDPAGPAAHGSAAERVAWFEAGFDRGYLGCGFSLLVA